MINVDKHCLKIAIYFTPILTQSGKNNFLSRVKLEQLQYIILVKV